MDFSALYFLSKAWFVIPWFCVGIAGAVWVMYDTLMVNTNVNSPLKAGWPIIIFFFSIIGVALYLITCRPPSIGRKRGEEAQKAHHAFVESMFKKVTGAAIHCVAGDGLGIVTAMVIARLLGFPFWDEFWFEYAVGFMCGWFIFQYWSMMKMSDSVVQRLWMAGRAEFFSMITVMTGMGLIMGNITSSVVGEQPKPYTYSFWTFAALGLLAGLILTYPMNWWMVRMGWKHGMA